jgi:hypothetical protein
VAAPAQHFVTSPSEAVVHIAVNYRDAWLETRAYVDGGPFVRTCATPCDVRLQVEGLEARVSAPNMTTSNVFRFDGGTGRASVRVEGGSATARTAGIVSLAVGIPLALAGMAMTAQGAIKDSSGLRGVGIVGLSIGSLGILASIPLLLKGSTSVKDARGDRIASSDRETLNQ